MLFLRIYATTLTFLLTLHVPHSGDGCRWTVLFTLTCRYDSPPAIFTTVHLIIPVPNRRHWCYDPCASTYVLNYHLRLLHTLPFYPLSRMIGCSYPDPGSGYEGSDVLQTVRDGIQYHRCAHTGTRYTAVVSCSFFFLPPHTFYAYAPRYYRVWLGGLTPFHFWLYTSYIVLVSSRIFRVDWFSSARSVDLTRMFPSISCETDLHITHVVMAIGGVCHWRLGWDALLSTV